MITAKTNDRVKFLFISMKVLNYFNLRTFLAVVISQIAAFLAIRYQIKFNVNVMLFGLVIAFPLHYTIQAAFKRREKALEYFSGFKGGLLTLYYSVQLATDLSTEKRVEGINILKAISDQVIHQLETREGNYELTQRKLNEMSTFIETNQKDLPKRNAVKMVRYLGNVSEATVYLLSLLKHRTMVGMRFYGIFFILVFPLIQAPILLHRLEGHVPYWMIYIFVCLTSLILVTLTNFQKLIEYPFDPGGMDNVRLREFKLDV